MREEQALLAQDYALEQAEEKGLERGKIEGSLSMLLNLVRQHLLTAEVASEQLGMTVAEFETYARRTSVIGSGLCLGDC